jgi:glycoprotein-N-acetylgalactosamine 3-beta-galactosyltransferase
MSANNLPRANARGLSSNHRQLLMLMAILLTVTAFTFRASLLDFNSGAYPYKTTTSKEVIADFWMPVVLIDNATSTSTTTEVDVRPKSTVTSFNKTKSETPPPPIPSLSSAPLKHAAATTGNPRTNTTANKNKTLSKSDEPPPPKHAAATTGNPRTNTTANKNNKTLSKSDEPPRPHPHAGARDAEGNWGYVADVTRIRRWMLQRYRETAGVNTTVSTSLPAEAGDEVFPPSSFLPMKDNEIEKVCGTQPGKGVEGTHGWDVVIKVVLDGPNPLPLPSSENRPTSPEPSLDQNSNNMSSTTYVPPKYVITTPEPNGVSKGKILCGIYTYDKMDYRTQGVSETWGWRCDGFLPVSTVTIDDPAIRGYGSVDVPHYGPEKYGNMWQKTRSILAYMYDNYFDEYEYFYLAGDDTHLIVENLRRYLYTVEQTHDVATEPLYMGMPYTFRILYNIGGAGYVLNRVALKRLVLEAFPTCHAKTQVSAEDRFVGLCLKSMHIDPLHTVDAQGRQRFLGQHPNSLGRDRGMKGFQAEWGRKYGWRTGADLVSESSITFHMFRTHELMKRHHAIIYNSCPIGSVLHTAVQKGRDARGNSTVAHVARR